MATISETWYEVLDRLVYREGLSRPQIARRAGVNAKTITSWLRGDVKRPRRWQPVARVLKALNATTEEADQVLLLAGYRTAAEMINSAANDEDRALLAGWQQPSAPFMAPDRPVGRLIGRESVLDRAQTAVARHRRVAIWGMGGVGKTTLAVELAHRLADAYRDGVYWGELRTSSPAAVLESWARACGIDLASMPDFNSRAAHMRGVFSQQRALIILDDVVDSQIAQQMIPTLHSDCAVIVTTRSAAVAQNLVHRKEQQLFALKPMRRQSSRQLFSGMIGEEVVAHDEAAVDRVAELLGDLPLALQIAAAICADSGLSLSTLATLLADMEKRLDHLQLDQKPVVRLAFEQSWQRLGDDMRAALASVGVFEGRAFSPEAFAAAAGTDEAQGLYLLARLARLSLLSETQVGRYQQHTLLAAFALEKLGDEVKPWEHFVAFYDAYLDRVALDSQLFIAEGDNLAAAMGAARRLERWDAVLRFSQRLQPLWRRQGAYVQSYEGAAWAQEAALAVGDPLAQAESSYYRGLASLEQSRYDEAGALLVKAAGLFRECEAAERVGDAYFYLSRVALGELDFEAAETAVQEAWRAYQQAEDVRGMGRALYRRGHIYYDRGQYERTLALIDDAIRTQSGGDDRRGLFQSLLIGVNASVQLKRFTEAEAYLERAAGVVQQMDDPEQTALFYYAYADLSRFTGQFERAVSYGKKALAAFRRTQDVYSQANALNMLAGVELLWNDADPKRQQYEAGLAYCREGLALCEAIGYDLAKGMMLLARGRLLAQRGDIEDACAAWRLSLAVADAIGHEWLQQRLQGLLTEASCPPNGQ